MRLPSNRAMVRQLLSVSRSRVGVMADIVLINPKFEISFWGLEHALPFVGKRANMPVAALPLLAALTPSGHSITLIDENVEPIDFERCARADIVGVTGMIVQRQRMREVLTELKRRGVFTVVGGPWITVKEDYFGDLADVMFIGEAEETGRGFLADWAAGCAAKRYEQEDKTDLSRVPAPRLDLIKMNRYAFGSVQFTRGCPFQCEFCDIIVTFGRRPRIKTIPQIIDELEAMRASFRNWRWASKMVASSLSKPTIMPAHTSMPAFWMRCTFSTMPPPARTFCSLRASRSESSLGLSMPTNTATMCASAISAISSASSARSSEASVTKRSG